MIYRESVEETIVKETVKTLRFIELNSLWYGEISCFVFYYPGGRQFPLFIIQTGEFQTKFIYD